MQSWILTRSRRCFYQLYKPRELGLEVWVFETGSWRRRHLVMA